MTLPYRMSTNHVQPDPDTLFSFGAPQPFVSLYAVVLGQGGHIFMNIVCIVALWFVRIVFTFFTSVHLLMISEHRDRHCRRLPSRLRCSP